MWFVRCLRVLSVALVLGLVAPTGLSAQDVSPQGGSLEINMEINPNAVATFTITNNNIATGGALGQTSDTYSITCSASGVVTGCTPDQAQVTIGRAGLYGPPECNPDACSVTVNVTLTLGSGSAGQVTLTATDQNGGGGTGSYSVSVQRPGLTVSPTGQSVTVATGTRASQTFTVTNSGNQALNTSLVAACSGAAISACGAPPATLLLAAGASGSVTIPYRVVGAEGTTGGITLTASVTSLSMEATGSVNVTAGPTPVVYVSGVEAGATVEKDRCLVFSIVPDVANECGSARITHGLPIVRTLNKPRAPTLIYYQDQAAPRPVLPVQVNLPSGASIPTSVRVTVSRRKPDGSISSLGAPKISDGAFWATDRRQQVAYAINLGDTVTTGILQYRVAVDFLYNGTWQPAAPAFDGELAIVSRINSPFGRGWWLVGLEQLVLNQPGGRILWVGGDGSARAYSPVNDSSWAAPGVDRPDTLKRRGNQYVRILPRGLRVSFNLQGQHTSTQNRLGQVTTFVYQAANPALLGHIVVPPSSAGLVYTFQYDSNWLLRGVVSPDTVGSRVTTINPDPRDARGVREIIDPDGTHVTFESPDDAVGVIRARSDRRGARTSIEPELNSATMAYAETPVGDGTVARHTFRTERAQGADLTPKAGPAVMSGRWG